LLCHSFFNKFNQIFNCNLLSLRLHTFQFNNLNYFMSCRHLNRLITLSSLIIFIWTIWRRMFLWTLNWKNWVSTKICIHYLMFEIFRSLASSMVVKRNSTPQTRSSTYCVKWDSACICSPTNRFYRLMSFVRW